MSHSNTSVTPTSTFASFGISSLANVALTTTFTPPPDCAGIYKSTGIAGVDLQTSCMPPGFRSSKQAYFSPGVICPSGYWSACQESRGEGSISSVTCSPHRGDISLLCANPATLLSDRQDIFCSWAPPPYPGTEVMVTVREEGRTTTMISLMVKGGDGTSPTGGIACYGVRMVYQSTDVVPSQTSPPTISSTSSPEPSAGDSVAVTVAIAVSIPLAVLAILIASYIWWNKRLQKYSQIGTDSSLLQEFPLEPYPNHPMASSGTSRQNHPLDPYHSYYAGQALGSDPRGRWAG